MSTETKRLKRHYRKFHKISGSEIVPFKEYASLYPKGQEWLDRKRRR